MTHTTEQERVDTTVFKRLLNDYADCLRNGDFQDAGAALLAVVAEYQQAARRAPAAPETAPVARPKPVGWFHRHPKECKNGEVCNYQIALADRKDGWEESPVYTEQQVHALLAETKAKKEGRRREEMNAAQTQPEPMRFTKKPVTIVANQWFKSGDHPAVRDISDSDDLFFTGMGGTVLVEREKFGVVGTLESPNHLVSPGDWIITGVRGEHYPCKPDIFEATYTPETKLQQGK